uniref:Deoxyribodipyrimidine photo-lyase n=1 Tax=Mantoniella antarctica TaxID=81844 RepID=A0A7S0SHQ2_9CHLO|mmetsp:Transcript_23923/g.59302  ORF Transcript_23923/g.59302 Transcript_23923/m.59302 type:complete len:610 (+) Transcript_23923:202-2031(+)|eukprot:CAMPEP_0181366174 /NCGR_PEP_ID=MMETSP1106-20121128/10530_1 /TAXON_ID=81844 /ORGANISM="Mantoniella antarctica, Strain SL-175" /LENGTH=609 /DNA_ID=CAMNT_0023481439 /DNA_START=195 /DNA_END=2024 /DNA_ORIENTATION=+
MGGKLVNKKRVRELKRGTPKAGDGPVVYWCSRDQRVADNWALIHACETAAAIGSPVAVVFSLVTKYLGAGARQFGFMLRGLREMEAALAAKGITFVLLEGDPSETVPAFAADCGAGLIVVDQSPLRLGREWRDAVATAAACPVHEVDAHNVVPVWEASPKLEVGARTLRGKLAKLYPEFLTEFPPLPAVTSEWSVAAAAAVAAKTPVAWDAIIARVVEAGKAVPEVTWAVPGERAAAVTLDHFLGRRLKLYESRNDPAKPQALSGLSPYLHFGHISGHRCALEAKKYTKAAPKAVESFFEELVVRRELADNFCHYSPQYDTLDGQKYDWAKDTLRLHAADARPYVYTLAQLEAGKTHDRLWNAAQLEMVHGGKMHGFMRMYWAKKILEWTEGPDQALEFAIYLNDTYQLDGRDPSGYVGCMWSIVGVHDQGWKERPIFGKIRYMAYTGCEKKFKIPDYIARVNELVAAVKAGKVDTSAINPGRFHIDFKAHLAGEGGSKGGTGGGSSGAGVGGGSGGGVGETAAETPPCTSEELTRLVRAAVAAAAGGEDSARAIDALKALKKATVTASLLSETQVGKEVKKLSKQGEDKEVAAAATAVVLAWKKVLLG